MGSSLATVQIYIANQEKEEVRSQIIDFLKNKATTESFAETTHDEQELPDREIFVGLINDTPWLTIYDTYGRLNELAQQLSVAIQGTTIFIQLIDSDVVHLARFDNGNLIDDYCNDPDLLDFYISENNTQSDWDHTDEYTIKSKARGDISKWQDLFKPDTDISNLRQKWDSDPVFADDILWPTITALGIDEEEVDANFGFGEIDFTRLTFDIVPTHTPNNGRPQSTDKIMAAEGLPVFDFASYVEIQRLYVNQKIDIQITIQNNGGANKGIDIVGWGSALDQNIITLQKAVVGTNIDEKQVELNFAQEKREYENNVISVQTISIPTLNFPAGIADSSEQLFRQGRNWRKVHQALTETYINILLSCEVKSTGLGELLLGFIPHANPENGSVTYLANITASTTPRRPLRCAQDTHMETLHLLESPTHLFALISLGAERKKVAENTANLIEKWISNIAGNNKTKFVTHLTTDPNLRPQKRVFSSADIPSSDEWQKIRLALNSCERFSIEYKNSCLIFDAYTGSLQNYGKEPMPHLMIRYLTSDFNRIELAATIDDLINNMNELMVNSSGLQAILGQWKWWTGKLFILDTTPYEAACLIGGQCTNTRFWCEQFLRGVTENIWLGQALLTRLEETDSLTKIATLSQVGNSKHVRLKKGATLDELEKVLAPLLPDESDWRKGMARIYSRE